MNIVLALLSLLLGPLLGGQPEGIRVPLGDGSVLRLEGGSTVQDWTCSTPSLEAWVREDPWGDQATHGSERGGLLVPVAALKCGNGRMEADLRNAVREDEHPVISFALTGWELASGEDGFHGTAHGRLTLAGVTREVEVEVRGEGDVSGEVRAIGTTRLLMTSFGIEPPSALFGLIKARNEVTVRFELTADAATVESLRASFRDAPAVARSLHIP